MHITFRPMPVEPKWKKIDKSVFQMKPTPGTAMLKLKYELGRIGATDIVLEAGFTENQLRNDDYPRADARPSHSTIRITFKRQGTTPMSMTCGGAADWWFNVHLIASTLERLRAIERYGCVQGAEQYAGWNALPPSQPIAASEWASVEQACRFLADTGGLVYTGGTLDAAMLDRFYEQAAKRAHPDVGGSNDLMAKVNRARAYIRGGGA
jgi:hypothetical protein